MTAALPADSGLTASSRATHPTPSRSRPAGGLGTPATGRPSMRSPIRRRPASPALPCHRRPPAGTRPWGSTSWTGTTSAPPPTRMPQPWTFSARPFTMPTGRPDGAPSSVPPRKAGRPPSGDRTTSCPDHREHDHAAARDDRTESCSWRHERPCDWGTLAHLDCRPGSGPPAGFWREDAMSEYTTRPLSAETGECLRPAMREAQQGVERLLVCVVPSALRGQRHWR